MIFKINKQYSSKAIEKNSKGIRTSGAVEGGKHTIVTDTNTFVMLVSGAWRGGNSLYYKCIK